MSIWVILALTKKFGFITEVDTSAPNFIKHKNSTVNEVMNSIWPLYRWVSLFCHLWPHYLSHHELMLHFVIPEKALLEWMIWKVWVGFLIWKKKN